MSLPVWILFVTVALAAVLSPGPAVLHAITNSMTFGWRRVAFSSLGNILGLLVLSSLAMAGMGALLKTSALLFTLLKLLGAGYLIHLGFRQWRSGASLFSQAETLSAAGHSSNGRIFRKGLMVALTNPKAILFFSALFPQFIRPDRVLAPQFLILTTTFMFLSFSALMSYGLVAHTARAWFADERRGTWFNRASGSVFFLLGIGMLRIKANRG
ncbi:MAG TPA: LysE family translocator [Holophaga sp.]|nr:LysE family translocator [Holophaga sp.]HPS68252.1 LysE family translocator [Holophaga sp.]